VATISQYLRAPPTVDQLNVGVNETPVEPFAGDEGNGAGKSAAAAMLQQPTRRTTERIGAEMPPLIRPRVIMSAPTCGFPRALGLLAWAVV
jgi:hypothetical protein